MVRIGLFLCAALLSLAGCGNAEPAASSTATRTATASGARVSGHRIPDGSYRRVITQEQKRGLGITLSNQELGFAPDGSLQDTIRILGDQWAQLANYNGDPPTVGSQGTLSYDSEGALIVNEPCCGKSRYTWDLEGDKLTLEADLEFSKAEHPGFDTTSQDTREWKLLTSGTYTRIR